MKMPVVAALFVLTMPVFVIGMIVSALWFALVAGFEFYHRQVEKSV